MNSSTFKDKCTLTMESMYQVLMLAQSWYSIVTNTSSTYLPVSSNEVLIILMITIIIMTMTVAWFL